jgi:D-aspartate ligase
MTPVLILDRNGRLDLVATRLLGRADVPVHLLLPRGRTTASRSRWCSATHAVAPLSADDDAQVAAIASVAARVADACGERPVMLFTWERFMMLISRHREQLEPLLRLDLPSHQPLVAAVDKVAFAERATAAGLPVPASVAVTAPHDIERACALGMPVFIKPPSNLSWGRIPRTLGIEPKGARIDSADRLRELLAAFVARGAPVLVQKSVEGPDVGHVAVHCYRHPNTGEMFGVCTVRRARVYPAGAGLGCFNVSEPFDELVEPSARAMEAMDLTGTASVQWKYDERHGWKLLEIGPRIALTMGIGHVAGVNSALIAYNSLLGLPVPPVTQRYGMAWLDLGHDRVSMRTYRRTGEWSTASWLLSMRSVRACAFFDPRDAAPWLHQLLFHRTY